MIRRVSGFTTLGKPYVFALFAMCSAVHGADAVQADGFAAYQHGDYETAWTQLEPLAARGDAEAQRVVGIMYLLGQGMEKDAPQAARWLKGAATRGDQKAQELLSYMHNEGLGVAQDDVLAYVWLKLAATGDTTPEKMQGMQTMIARLTGRMSNDERQRARSLSRQYYERYAKPFR